MILKTKLQQFGMVLTLLVACDTLNAQTLSLASNNPAERNQPLIEATLEYKTSSEQLLEIEEDQVANYAKQVDLLRELYAEGLIARVELEQSEQALNAAREKLAETRQQITAADHMIVEIKAAEELAKVQASRSLTRPTASFSSTATIIRHSGAINSVNNLQQINSFFSGRFGRPLPVSAHGQTPTHDRLGYDHRHAVDVAVHPDSAEGKALMEYLRSQGISFLAFRGAVPGVSTGPHIHIGRPSSRI